jgi:hypothetical protein
MITKGSQIIKDILTTILYRGKHDHYSDKKIGELLLATNLSQQTKWNELDDNGNNKLSSKELKMGWSPLLRTSNSNVDKNNMYKERQRKDTAMLAGNSQMHDCELLSFDIQVCEIWEMFGWEWLVSNRF